MDPAQAQACQKQVEMISILVRELPLEEFIASFTVGGGSTMTEPVKRAQLLLPLKKHLTTKG